MHLKCRSWLVASAVGAALCLVPVAGSAFDLTPPAKSFEEERAVAASQHEQILAEFNGAYEDAELAAYVTRVGERVAAASEMPNNPFRFTVLNTPMVNAFTVGGGYVYVTRGILASINSEAELAALLAHEVGHVTARHTARRETRIRQDRAVSVGVGLLTGSLSSAVLSETLSAFNRQAYSRKQENQADELGVETIDRAGYDPNAMAAMLGSLEREVALMNKMAGNDPDAGPGIPVWLSDHPETGDRITRTTARAAATGRAGTGDVGRDAHLNAIDGILFGPDPRFGVLMDGTFLHPGLRVAFDIPDGYSFQSLPGAVIAVRDDSSLVMFTGAEWPADRSLEEFALSAWYAITDGDEGALDSLETTEINGLPAVIVTKQVDRLLSQGTLASVAYRVGEDEVFSLSFLIAGDLTAPVFEEFKGIADSFRPLSYADINAIPIPTVRVVDVGAGDTLETLADQMIGDPAFRADRLKALNGIEGESVDAERVKLVVDGRE